MFRTCASPHPPTPPNTTPTSARLLSTLPWRLTHPWIIPPAQSPSPYTNYAFSAVSHDCRWVIACAAPSTKAFALLREGHLKIHFVCSDPDRVSALAKPLLAAVAMYNVHTVTTFDNHLAVALKRALRLTPRKRIARRYFVGTGLPAALDVTSFQSGDGDIGFV